MNQNSNKVSYWQIAYEPLPNPWVFYVRVAQTILTLLVLGLTIYASTQLIGGSGIAFTFFTVAWSILWLKLNRWGVKYVPPKYRPNFAVLAVEAITCLWWLVTLGLLGTTASAYASVLALYDSYGLKAKRSPYSTSDSSTSSTDSTVSSVADSVSEALNLPNWRAGTHAIQGATAVAALNWVLFVVTIYAVIKKIRLARAGQTQAPQQQSTDIAFNPHAHAHTNPFEEDKNMHVSSNFV